MNMLGLRDKIVAEECVWDIWIRREKSNQDLFILLWMWIEKLIYDTDILDEILCVKYSNSSVT